MTGSERGEPVALTVTDHHAGGSPGVVIPGTDRRSLEVFLKTHDLCRGPMTVTPIGEGHSNLTYLLSDAEARVVLRRPPPPPLPRGSNDVMREARLLRALEGSDVPVPRILAVDDSQKVMDVPFYVMEYLDGVVATKATPPPLDVPEERGRIATILIDTLAALHGVDWQARGLDTFGRPEGFLERQLDRIGTLVDDDGGEVSRGIAEVTTWLRARLPASEAAGIVHGDYRLGNAMFSHDAPARMIAMLDWELSAIGDPLADVGYFLAAYARPSTPLQPLSELGMATVESGYPEAAELAERYASTTGRDLSELAWYTTFALWKLTVFYERNRRRYRAGIIDDAYYAEPGVVERLLEGARTAAGGLP